MPDFHLTNAMWHGQKKMAFSECSWSNQRQLSACPFTRTAFRLWLQMQIVGNRAEQGGLCASAPKEAVWTQPIYESQTLCNSLPLSRQRMYLSNHLNYYNHCWDGNARISSLTLWNFQGPESTPRWVLVSLQNRIMLCEMSLPKLTELNQNRHTEKRMLYVVTTALVQRKTY